MPGLETPAARDAAATKRSYAFIAWSSVIAWAVLLGVVGAVTAKAGPLLSDDAFVATAGATSVALLGWLAFLRGLRRRDLERIEGTRAGRYDPRSR